MKAGPLAAALCLASGLASCATLPEPAGGDQNLPNASAGPFRALSDSADVIGDAGIVPGASELGNSRSAPDGLDDSRNYGRDITVLDADGDPTTLGVVAYVAAAATMGGMDPTQTTPTSTLVRYGALDGRSFDYSAEVVLKADAPWEGGLMASPSAVLVGGQTFLYYAAAGGIGLARSSDGHAFTKVAAPVLAPATGAGAGDWEQGAVPASPGVVALPDGSLRMFYEVPRGGGVTAIGEASSGDGTTWTRLGSAPVLAAVGSGDAGETWDAASVGSPFPQVATSAAGRPVMRLFYGARDGAGVQTIALAARQGTDGPFVRAVSPVFGTSNALGPREPCTVVFAGFTLLYATQSSSSSGGHPAIAVGVAPATTVLPAPVPM
jgi:hypothetical protein